MTLVLLCLLVAYLLSVLLQACMRARLFISPSVPLCHSTADCSVRADQICVHPMLEQADERLVCVSRNAPPAGPADEAAATTEAAPFAEHIRRSRYDPATGATVADPQPGLSRSYFLWMGHPSELLSAVSLSDYRPRPWLLSLLAAVGAGPSSAGSGGPAGWLWRAVHRWPGWLSRGLRYVISVSMSLALLNSAPVHMADGAVSLGEMAAAWGAPGAALGRLCAKLGIAGEAARQRAVAKTLFVGSALLLVNVLLSFVQFLL